MASSEAEAVEVVGEGSGHEPERAGPAGDLRAIQCQLENPKKPGSKSHACYELYKVARSVGELWLLGGTLADLRHDVSKGFVVYEDARMACPAQDGTPGVASSEGGDGRRVKAGGGRRSGLCGVESTHPGEGPATPGRSSCRSLGHSFLRRPPSL